jgi:hypothetical protein
MIQICLRDDEFEVLTAMFTNIPVSWHVAPNSLFQINLHFGETCPIRSSETLVASNGLHDVISQTIEIFVFNSYHYI